MFFIRLEIVNNNFERLFNICNFGRVVLIGITGLLGQDALLNVEVASQTEHVFVSTVIQVIVVAEEKSLFHVNAMWRQVHLLKVSFLIIHKLSSIIVWSV